MTMRAVLLLSVALCGRVRSQCAPFDTDPVIGAPIASADMIQCVDDATSVPTASPAPDATVCNVTCLTDTYPPAAGNNEYRCVRQPPTAAENGCIEMFMWVSQLTDGVQVACSAARCETFQAFSSSTFPGLGDVSCGASTADAVENLNDVCTVNMCAAGYMPNADAMHREFTCRVDATTPISAATWFSAAVTGGQPPQPPCIPVTCPAFNTFAVPADTTAFACTADNVAAEVGQPAVVGQTCTIACTTAGQGLTDATASFTCGADGMWASPDPLPTCEAVQCGPFADVDLTTLSPNAMVVNPPCANVMVDETCEAECGASYALVGGPGNATFTCTANSDRSNVGVWQTSSMCLPDGIMCPALSGSITNINATATSCGGANNGDTADLPFGTMCTLACNDGYLPDRADAMYTCSATRDTTPMPMWQGMAQCVQTCEPPTAMTTDGGFNAGAFMNGVIMCATALGAPADLAQPGLEGTVCTATCTTPGYGFAVAGQTTVTCMGGAWTPTDEMARPQCNLIQCPAFDTATIAANAVRTMCNQGPTPTQCTFDQPIDAVDEPGVACQVGCMPDFLLANQKERLYTCVAPADGTAAGTWTGAAVCNARCSEAAILSPDGTYTADCCDMRATPCILGYGGCAMDDDCGGPLVCGMAGQSCSTAINGVQADARCCVNPPTCPDFMPWATTNLSPGVNFTAGDRFDCTSMAAIDSVCTITCRDMYELANSSVNALTCMDRGGTPEWAGDAPVCQQTVTMEPAAPCSPDAITGPDGAWAADCCANLPNNMTCGEGYGGCADNDQCTGDLVCGMADMSCSDRIEEAAGDNANTTRCCVAVATGPPGTDEPVQGANTLQTQFVTVLVAVTSVVTFVFVA